MKVQVRHALAGMPAAVGDQAVTALADAQLAGDSIGCPQAGGQLRVGQAVQVTQACRVPPGDDQGMAGGLRLDVQKGKAVLVLPDLL